MNDKIIDYALKLGEVGDMLSEASLCYSFDGNLEKLQANLIIYIEKAFNGIYKYNECLIKLKSINAPDCVRKQHLGLITLLNEYIEIIQSMFTKIKNKEDITVKELLECINNQRNNTQKTLLLCNKVGDILVKNMD